MLMAHNENNTSIVIPHSNLHQKFWLFLSFIRHFLKLLKIINLTGATGHCTMGVSMRPVIGEIVSQLAIEENIGIDLKKVTVDRFNT